MDRSSRGISVQCRLENGRRRMMSWLPKERAVKGKVFSIKNARSGDWEEGWIVMETGVSKLYESVREEGLDCISPRNIREN